MLRVIEAQLASGTATDSERRALQQARTLMSNQQQESRQLAKAVAIFSPGMSSEVSYHSGSNAFVGQGYTSNAGNTYFSAMRMSSSIVIKADIGIGYSRTFLNGIYIYSADGKRQLLAHRDYHCRFYHEHDVRQEAVSLMSQAILAEVPASDRDCFGEQARLLAARCVADAYERNQVETLQQNLRLLR